jgi:hypothetical protein
MEAQAVPTVPVARLAYDDSPSAQRRLVIVLSAFVTCVAAALIVFCVGYAHLTAASGNGSLGTTMALVGVVSIDVLYWLFFVKMLSTLPTEKTWLGLWRVLLALATLTSVIAFGMILSAALRCGKPGARCATHELLDLQAVRECAAIIVALPMVWTAIHAMVELWTCVTRAKRPTALLTPTAHHVGWY